MLPPSSFILLSSTTVTLLSVHCNSIVIVIVLWPFYVHNTAILLLLQCPCSLTCCHWRHTVDLLSLCSCSTGGHMASCGIPLSWLGAMGPPPPRDAALHCHTQHLGSGCCRTTQCLLGEIPHKASQRPIRVGVCFWGRFASSWPCIFQLMLLQNAIYFQPIDHSLATHRVINALFN